MFVAASTNCFAHLPREEAIEKLCDLEFSAIELVISDEGDTIRPSSVVNEFEAAVALVNSTRRLDVVSFGLETNVDAPDFMQTYEAVCKLAKDVKCHGAH